MKVEVGPIFNRRRESVRSSSIVSWRQNTLNRGNFRFYPRLVLKRLPRNLTCRWNYVFSESRGSTQIPDCRLPSTGISWKTSNHGGMERYGRPVVEGRVVPCDPREREGDLTGKVVRGDFPCVNQTLHSWLHESYGVFVTVRDPHGFKGPRSVDKSVEVELFQE